MVPLMLKTLKENIILSGLPPTRSTLHGFFSGESVPGVLENLTTNKDTHSVDAALGSFPLMVLSLWEEKSTQQDYVRVQASG